MTRSEFDQQVRELKNKKGNAIREIAALQSEVKEEMASKYRQIDEIRKEISKLQQLLQGYHQRRLALEKEWYAKVNDFIRENEPSTTSNLAEATTVNIVYELRRRGFRGFIRNNEIGKIYDLEKQFTQSESDDDGAGE